MFDYSSTYTCTHSESIFSFKMTFNSFCIYRSVFFNGQIEKQVSGLTSLLDHPDIPVRVAINRDAVHVIDPKKNVRLSLHHLVLIDFAYEPPYGKQF